MSLPTDGPWPPTLEVVKNTGSIRSKSCSSRIRCMSTEPTMPRQPIRPTRFIATTPFTKSGPRLKGGPEILQIPQRGDYGVTHFLSADLRFAFIPDVTGTQTLIENQADGLLDGFGSGVLVEAVTQHHRDRQNRRQRVGNAFTGDVRSRTMARLVHTFVAGIQGRRWQHA